ncbi:MAG: bifunctional [glutamate--ammonia ligase]-adenylyl-L-tyrosine phosphorylase/[glutamate--ammonia-ligase] adenylyltransferase [Verrucomicrobia bacterium]|nr:bifunctional [glutamate--ammonia ligase]-adenylyl-L-tyrosine phosphorylase/[glutamate--ammonia-ligase] adenylyltransferase [Verrucomicrobiota bacterium]
MAALDNPPEMRFNQAMTGTVWQNAIRSCADSARARQGLEKLQSTGAASVLQSVSPEQARVLAALWSGSEALSELFAAHPEWLATLLDTESLRGPRRAQGLEREVQSWLGPLLDTANYAGAYAKLRQFKQREMLRIAARDLARWGDVREITREISDVADVCLETVYQLCARQLTERLGQPYHQDAGGPWRPTEFCVLGMGKLGGQELNYSSDVDVLFVYEEEGHLFKLPPRKGQNPGSGLSNHQFFRRLSEAIIAELSALTSDGALFRIDLRLRPEGDAGPLARSLSSYENYYAQWGQTWERMMLIKARRVAGNVALSTEFLEMIQPFRYPRALSERILQEIADMKQRIENEVVRSGEMDRNVKLGRGGIREIEFVAQSLQLLHAGRAPFLQDSQTLSTLQKLVRYGVLPAGDARDLIEAYGFLREVEHRLQMEGNLQTHTIPSDPPACQRLAALMGFDSTAAFENTRQTHCENVRRIYGALLQTKQSPTGKKLPDLQEGEAAWRALLDEHRFRDAERAWPMLREFVQGPGYVHLSPRTSELALELVSRFLALCRGQSVKAPHAQSGPIRLSDPDRVLARLDSFVSAYGSRALLYETWVNNPALFELLLLLFDRSEFLAEIAIRTPDLVDELVLSGRLRRRKMAEEILEDLRYGLADPDQSAWLRRYYYAELMRLGLRDIAGLADFEQNLAELSALAEACLQYALDVVMRRHKLRTAPFAIVGLGKLGGAEINYGSDLDILFVAGPAQKKLPRLQRLAAEVMELLSKPTEAGVTFLTDPRLRPDGEKGLLVNTLAAHEEYYRHRAQQWEIQAISRARPVAGHADTGRKFAELAARLSNFRTPSLPLAAYSSAWKSEIHKMRLRIEEERTPPGKEPLAIKTGAGGLIDAEFLAQVLCLENGFHEPNTLRALERGRETHAMPEGDAVALLENYRKLRRIEGILRRWSFEGETLLPDDPAPLYRVAVRCGFANADDFMKAVAGYRKAIREVYLNSLKRWRVTGVN